METDWIVQADVAHLIQEIFPGDSDFNINEENFPNSKDFIIYNAAVREIEDAKNDVHRKGITNFERFPLLRRSDFLQPKKTTFLNSKHPEDGEKIPIDEREPRKKKKVRSRIRKPLPLNSILVVQPLKIKFRNFVINQEYQARVTIRNVSNKLARYRLEKCLENSKFQITLATPNGRFVRENLAPGMHAILTIIFKTHSPGDHAEKIVLNVQNGKPVIISVRAFRDPPKLLIEFLSRNMELFSSQSLVSPQSSEFSLINTSRKGSRIELHLENELDLNKCFVGEEINTEIRLTNFGGSGSFLVMSEVDWYSSSIHSMTNKNRIFLDSFKIWPACFSLQANESIILQIDFTPKTFGLHVDKLFIICENTPIQHLDILGDGIVFDPNFIHFGSNFIKELLDEENESSRFLKIIIESIEFEKSVTVSNLSEIDMNFRWEISSYFENISGNQSLQHSSDWLRIEPESGVFRGSTSLIFKITNSRRVSIEENKYILQFIIEDIPVESLPLDIGLMTEPCKIHRRICRDSVDIVMSLVEVQTS